MTPGEPLSGLVVYTDRVRIGVYDLATRSETSFTPGAASAGGAGISPSRQISWMERPDVFTFRIALYDPRGQRLRQLDFFQERTVASSPAFISRDGVRITWSADEPVLDFGPRTERVRVVELARPDDPQRMFEGFTDPAWAGTSGELLMRRVSDNTLHVRSATSADLGAIAGVTLQPLTGSYAASPDGNHIAWTAGSTLRMIDRRDRTQWAAVTDPAGGTFLAVTFSADGRGLVAVLQRGGASSLVAVAWQAGPSVTIDASSALPGVTFGSFLGRISAAP
ncbi:MAG TPA: hypothetical protein VLK85_18135 [Ramlibacter sp.]|nr:hypothetical protein [Ramlibacter sp.]